MGLIVLFHTIHNWIILQLFYSLEIYRHMELLSSDNLKPLIKSDQRCSDKTKLNALYLSVEF